MLRNIAPADRMTVESILKEHGIKMIDEVRFRVRDGVRDRGIKMIDEVRLRVRDGVRGSTASR